MAKKLQPLYLVGILGLVVLALSFSVYALAYNDKIIPGVHFGTLGLGGMSLEEAQAELQERTQALSEQGIVVSIDDKQEDIALDAISFQVPIEQVVNEAWNLGRQGSWYARMGDRLMAPLIGYQIQEPVQVNDFQLEQELETVAAVRLQITGTKIVILYDTKSGTTIDIEQAKDKIKKSLSSLSDEPVRLALYEDVPRANAQTAPSAKQEAERILSQPL
ncbi:MAG: peptidoglycan binding domain-containing protein, partial [Candidatus Yanofskybacteria bacterium]|nr:peptidoglycan binding domain-containing protein [Candidatus Yanofskybacteria bacterium]